MLVWIPIITPYSCLGLWKSDTNTKSGWGSSQNCLCQSVAIWVFYFIFAVTPILLPDQCTMSTSMSFTDNTKLTLTYFSLQIQTCSFNTKCRPLGCIPLKKHNCSSTIGFNCQGIKVRGGMDLPQQPVWIL